MFLINPIIFEVGEDGKFTALKVDGHRVSATDILGTVMRIQLFCSPHVKQMMHTWGASEQHPDGSMEQSLQMSAFAANVFVQKYVPTSSWPMEDVQALWDLAVLEVARMCPAQFLITRKAAVEG